MQILRPKVKAATPKPQKSLQEKYPDTYKPEIEAIEVPIDESRKFVVNVRRAGDLGLPCVDVRTFQTTEAYTGFTKKGINFPLNLLPDVIRALQEADVACGAKHLYSEFTEE